MSATAIPQLKICDQNLIGAYVDGELDADLTLRLEEHLTDCADCQFELRAHRLFVCELDSVLHTRSAEIPVPADFSRRVAARATSDMSGVRTCSENRKALAICLVLALAGFALVGTAARDIFFLVSERLRTGVAGRNILRGPRQNRLDLSLTKSLDLGFTHLENDRFEIRFDYFNALNTPQFAPGSGDVTDTTFNDFRFNTGNLNIGNVNGGRIGQFQLRYVF